MDKIRDFRDLKVWQKSHELFLELVKDTETFPLTQSGKIVASQLLRACGSISANIAEGFGRRQGKEYLHYLIVARGSTTETLNWIIKCFELKWIGKDRYEDIGNLIQEILKMLNKMINQKLNH